MLVMADDNALALGLLAKDFVSARKMGDGKRIIRLYKFLLLYFKLESRSKYSYYSLYTIMQAFHLLPPSLAHELVWNRTNNSKGKINSNVENDRTCEHHVKSFKSDRKDFQGKVSSKSIKRASCSYTAMNQLMSTYDTELSVKHQSGRHSKPDTSSDVKSLAKQYSAHKVCLSVPGRNHTAFPGMERNLLQKLDIPALAEWVSDKIKKFDSINLFRKLRN